MSESQGFTPAQQSYLQGLALGADVARKVRGLPVLAGAASRGETIVLGGQLAAGGKLCDEELAKRRQNGLDIWDQMQRQADEGVFPQGTDVFLQKFHGLFYVAPAQDSYMCRLRFPGGAVTSYQLRGVANLADRYGAGHADVTTRANLQLREIGPRDALNLLMGLRDLGIINTGAGADNIRNVTASPLSGVDATELIETLPLARQLHYYILHHRELYGLPRKFNIAFDGGGVISALADTNDISFQAVRSLADDTSSTGTPDVLFALGLGGITGHGDFARETGIYLRASECLPVAAAIVRVFIAHGNRSDRKRARLKYLLDDWGMERFLDQVERELGQPLRRLPAASFSPRNAEVRLAHIGAHPQKQADRYYLGVVPTAGRLSAKQMRTLAHLSERYGDGDLRLTPWQNILLTGIHTTDLPAVYAALESIQLNWQASNLRAGLVACTGNAGCRFAAADTKQHAIYLADYVDQRLDLDQPLNLHLTGCHHSCAQHYIGDIGLLATAVAQDDDVVEGYHVFVGGGYGPRQRLGRQLYAAVPFSEIPARIVRLIELYQARRTSADESFAQFAERHEVDQLRELLEAPAVPTCVTLSNGFDFRREPSHVRS
jgi:ferredoxin-nitrite reductase